MELTQSDVVFSRIAMVLFLCTNKSSRNDLKIQYRRRNQHQGAHTLSTRVQGAPLVRAPCLVAPLGLHRPQPQLHIFMFGEKKNQGESFIAFYDTEPPSPPVLHREGRSGVRSGLRIGEIVAIITNLPPSPISGCSPPCVNNPIVGLLDSDGLDEIYNIIELVLLGFDPSIHYVPRLMLL